MFGSRYRLIEANWNVFNDWECKFKCFIFNQTLKVRYPITVWAPGVFKLWPFFFFGFDFCRFCVIIRFFHARHNGQRPSTSKDFYPRFYPLHFSSYLYSLERASISLFNVECQQGNCWCHFYNVFGMTWSLTGDWTRDLPPALYH